jgi:lipoprotein-anchoring transpeptidase ErfK/SrfK
VTTTMDGNTASDGNYSIQDVPWTMFFHKSFALHGAFWHDSFGRVRSHGCVNLGPSDARWLFEWTTPVLPEGWHGVHAHDGSPGTTIVVRD